MADENGVLEGDGELGEAGRGRVGGHGAGGGVIPVVEHAMHDTKLEVSAVSVVKIDYADEL